MHSMIRLYSTPEVFALQPTSSEGSEWLLIDRTSQKISLTRDYKVNTDAKVQDIFGIYGIISLLAGPYLIVITGRAPIGKLRSQPIYKVTRWELIPFSRTNLSPAVEEDERDYKNMVTEIMNINSFYYSTSYDLTQSLQRASQFTSNQPLLERLDRTFFWNEDLTRLLQENQLHDWIVPVILGFIQIETFQSASKSFQVALISRRSNKRVGTRYNVRGADSEGNVANFVETEVIVETIETESSLSKVASFVQTRGSIPLYWTQIVNIKYKPPLGFPKPQDSMAAYVSHMNQQMKKYGKQLLVCLIDQKGSELKLFKSYQEATEKFGNPAVCFYGFDFHTECKNLRYDRLSILLDQVKPQLDEIGYFYQEDGKTLITQKGVFRTNCMDNIDRTNVVQALFCREALGKIFVKMGLLDSQNLSTFKSSYSAPNFDKKYKEIWADNADTISFQYTGTGALKNDFTRTGKRTWQGLLNDGKNSVMRYYLNNFHDGFRQDAFDLMVGNYKVDATTRSPFASRKQSRQTLFLLAMIILVILSLASFLLPGGSTIMSQTITISGWALTLVGVYLVCLAFGPQVVDRPTFHKTF